MVYRDRVVGHVRKLDDHFKKDRTPPVVEKQ